MGAPLDTLGSRGANIHRVRAPGKRRICNGERKREKVKEEEKEEEEEAGE